MNAFLQRLKQRKLVQWAIAWVAFAFALLQGLDIIAQRFNWPGAVERYLILALAVGFFVVLVLAWYHGERGAQRIGGAELLILALLLTIGGTLMWRFAPVAASGPAAAPPSETFAVQRPSAIAVPILAAQPVPAKSIAVLPFENLSSDKDNDYFVAGMQDLILTKLADIGDLKVIARTSTAKYSSHPDDLKSVGRQLGVASILEGSVQKQGKQVLINVQLIDTRSNNHIWAKDYTRALDNVFGVEGEVAEKIATALDAKLSSAEAARLTTVPTRNEAALDLFLRAEYQTSQAELGGGNPLRLAAAIPLYRQAIQKDPGFALAYARLSYAESDFTYEGAGGQDAAQLDVLARADAEQALKLEPDLASAQLALGYNDYWGHRDFDGALKAFTAALALRPNDPGALEGQGLTQRRMGRFDAAIMSLEQAFTQNPRNSVLAADIGSTYMMMERYPDAERWLLRALTLDPDNISAKEDLAHSILLGSGDIARALAITDPAPRGTTAPMGYSNRIKVGTRVPLLIYQRRYRQALELLDSVPVNVPDPFLAYVVIGKPQTMARLFRLLGEPERATPLYAQALPILRTQLKMQRAIAQGAVWNRIAEAELGLGHAAEGLDALAKSQAIASKSHDHLSAPRLMQANAGLYVEARRPDLAISLLTKALATPGVGGDYSPVMLWLDPDWDPIRHDPRFQALLQKYATYKPTVTYDNPPGS
ncbi:MAG TPA: tetratricopeptide repeat protein [Rhodanobacteraceae bacterium]|nr:tetratricopeptide repeat protein [Rhodanobacteraceae bacterium]